MAQETTRSSPFDLAGECCKTIRLDDPDVLRHMVGSCTVFSAYRIAACLQRESMAATLRTAEGKECGISYTQRNSKRRGSSEYEVLAMTDETPSVMFQNDSSPMTNEMMAHLQAYARRSEERLAAARSACGHVVPCEFSVEMPYQLGMPHRGQGPNARNLALVGLLYRAAAPSEDYRAPLVNPKAFACTATLLDAMLARVAYPGYADWHGFRSPDLEVVLLKVPNHHAPTVEYKDGATGRGIFALSLEYDPQSGGPGSSVIRLVITNRCAGCGHEESFRLPQATSGRSDPFVVLENRCGCASKHRIAVYADGAILWSLACIPIIVQRLASAASRTHALAGYTLKRPREEIGTEDAAGDVREGPPCCTPCSASCSTPSDEPVPAPSPCPAAPAPVVFRSSHDDERIPVPSEEFLSKIESGLVYRKRAEQTESVFIMYSPSRGVMETEQAEVMKLFTSNNADDFQWKFQRRITSRVEAKRMHDTRTYTHLELQHGGAVKKAGSTPLWAINRRSDKRVVQLSTLSGIRDFVSFWRTFAASPRPPAAPEADDESMDIDRRIAVLKQNLEAPRRLFAPSFHYLVEPSGNRGKAGKVRRSATLYVQRVRQLAEALIIQKVVSGSVLVVSVAVVMYFIPLMVHSRILKPLLDSSAMRCCFLELHRHMLSGANTLAELVEAREGLHEAFRDRSMLPNGTKWVDTLFQTWEQMRDGKISLGHEFDYCHALTHRRPRVRHATRHATAPPSP